MDQAVGMIEGTPDSAETWGGAKVKAHFLQLLQQDIRTIIFDTATPVVAPQTPTASRQYPD